MARSLSLIAAAAACLFVAPSVAQTPDSPAMELSQDVRRNAELARQAISQNNFQGAAGYLAQANSQLQTDGDRYVVASLELDAANRTFNRGGQLAAIDKLVSNPLVTEEARAQLYYHRGRITYHEQDLDAARSALRQAIERGSTHPRTYIALASIETDRQNWAAALQLYEQIAAIMQRNGERIPEDWYRRAIDLAQRVGNIGKANENAQRLIAAYPSARNWRDVLSFYRKTGNPDPLAALDSWRLQAAAGALAGETDYRDYAQAASTAQQPGEVVRIVAAGRAANMLDGNNDVINGLLRTAQRTADTARGRLEQRATAAQAAATGADAKAVADDFLGFGDYARAAALYRTALEKGGVDAALVNSRLGMALALSGSPAEARTALDQVGGDRGWVSRYWGVYADSLPPPATQAASPTPEPNPADGN